MHPFLLLACLTVAAFSLAPSPAAGWSVANLTIHSITSPQCRNNAEFGQALDCVLPATLTIVHLTSATQHTQSAAYQFGLNVLLLPSVDFNLAFTSVVTPRPTIIDGNGTTAGEATNSTWKIDLVLPGYVQPALGTLLNVSFYPYRDLSTTSPPFAGLSILNSPPPQLTAVSGCNNTGLSTVNCDVDTGVLTLTGSGFHGCKVSTSTMSSLARVYSTSTYSGTRAW